MAPIDQITTGRERKPRRVMLYGTQGIGKSTWAASAPKPIFIQTEDGLGEIDCDKFPVAKTFDEVMASLGELYTEKHGYRTVVVDSLDWLERLIWADICRQREVKNIDDIEYGKGYGFALTLWRDFIEGLSALRADRGMTPILIAHAKIERFQNPETDAYDRYSPRIHKTAAHLIQEWADEVLFASYKVFTKQTEEAFKKKRTQGIGTGERVIRTMERPAYQAKNRLNLPDELSLDWNAYAAFIDGGNGKKEKPKTDTTAIVAKAAQTKGAK